MASLKVTVPDQMKDWVQAKVRSGACKSSSGYIQALIRREQRNAEKVAATSPAP